MDINRLLRIIIIIRKDGDLDLSVGCGLYGSRSECELAVDHKKGVDMTK